MKVKKDFLLAVKDCLEAYISTLKFIKEEDEFMDGLREARLYDCETLLIEVNSILKEGK